MMSEIAGAFSWTPADMERFTARELVRWYKKAIEKRTNDKKDLIELITMVVGKALGG